MGTPCLRDLLRQLPIYCQMKASVWGPSGSSAYFGLIALRVFCGFRVLFFIQRNDGIHGLCGIFPKYGISGLRGFCGMFLNYGIRGISGLCGFNGLREFCSGTETARLWRLRLAAHGLNSIDRAS